MKKTDVFDRLDNVLGNYAENKATSFEVYQVAYDVNKYLNEHPHQHDTLNCSKCDDNEVPFRPYIEDVANSLYPNLKPLEGVRGEYECKQVNKLLRTYRSIFIEGYQYSQNPHPHDLIVQPCSYYIPSLDTNMNCLNCGHPKMMH